jgi:hypothetical protein
MSHAKWSKNLFAVLCAALFLAGTFSSPVSSQSVFETVAEARTEPEAFVMEHEECPDERYEYYGEPGLGPSSATVGECTTSLRKVLDTAKQCIEWANTTIDQNASELDSESCTGSCQDEFCEWLCDGAPCDATDCWSGPCNATALIVRPREGRLGEPYALPSMSVNNPLDGGSLPSVASQDWDHDGTPDMVDSVNLPSEAVFNATSADRIMLPAGLSADGFMLLLEPGHNEAYLIEARNPLRVNDTLNATLDLIGNATTEGRQRLGMAVNDALAMFLDARVETHHVIVEASVPTNVSLTWTGGAIPADGSWLLVRNHPTDPVLAVLGGKNATVLPGLASQHGPRPELDVRWEILNMHGNESFCFDPTSTTGLTGCTGLINAGWRRVYSARAEYALQALVSAVHQGTLPLPWFDYEQLTAVPDVANETQDLLDYAEQAPLPDAPITVPLSMSSGPSLAPSLDPDCPSPKDDWFQAANFEYTNQGEHAIQPFGSKNIKHRPGIGTNYRFLGASGLTTVDPHLIQSDWNPGSEVPDQLRSVERRFVFEAWNVVTPATPKDLRHVNLRITSIGCDETGQSFLITGEALYGPLGFQGGDELHVTIDEDHDAGFAYLAEDFDGDGATDLLIHVPHFSAAWITIQTRDPETFTEWWDVHMTSQTTGWLSGTRGAVYRYQGPAASLVKYDIPVIASTKRTLGMHIVSDTEFWVVGEGGGGSCSDQPFIAHYKSPTLSTSPSAWVVTKLGGTCQDLHDVWVSSSGWVGYAAGSGNAWYSYDGSSWSPTSSVRPPLSDCSVMRIAFGSTANGYIGLNKGSLGGPSCEANTDVSAIMRLNSGTFTKVSGSDVGPIYDIEAGQEYAAGFKQSPGTTGAYAQSTPDDWGPHSGGPATDLFGVAQTPTTGEVWYSGRTTPGAGTGDVWRYDGSWTKMHHVDPLNQLKDIDLYDDFHGLAVGLNQIVVITINDPPKEYSTLTPLSGTTQDAFIGNDGSGSSVSHDPDGTTITHEWIWGDGSTPDTTADATHHYSQVGSFSVIHRVTDVDGDYDQTVRTVNVNAEAIAKDACHSGSFPATLPKRNHYVLPSHFEEQYAVVAFCDAPSGLQIRGRMDDPVGTTGEWPSLGAVGATLEGVTTPGQLYLSIERSSAAASSAFQVKATFFDGPDDPTEVATPSKARGGLPVAISAKVGHPEGFGVALWIDWGDGTIIGASPSSFDAAGSTMTRTHTYTTSGTYTVKIKGIDENGVKSWHVTRSIQVFTDPVGVATGATGVTKDAADLGAAITGLGGAAPVTARFKLYEDGTALDPMGSYYRYSTGSFGPHAARGLKAGEVYDYALLLTNDVTTVETPKSSFATDPSSPIGVGVSLSTSTPTTTLGVSASLTMVTDSYYADPVRYHVRWGDGTSQYEPSTGTTAWDTPLTATHKYELPGTYTARVRVEDMSGKQSAFVAEVLTVVGDVVADVSHVGLDKTAQISVKAGTIVTSPGTDIRIKVFDPLTGHWDPYGWVEDVTTGTTVTWTTPDLVAEVDYPVQVEVRTASGNTWESEAPHYQAAANKAPVITASLEDSEQSYTSSVRFELTYLDADGDAPENSLGTSSPPTVTLGGTSYDMEVVGLATGDHARGVAYEYTLDPVPGQSYTPVFKAWSDYGRSATVTGGTVFASAEAVAMHSYESALVGGIPAGFTPQENPGRVGTNYWHVTDTSSATHANDVKLGFKGKALWFGREVTGSYQSPHGRSTGGDLVTPVFDLRTVVDPVLSFSSFYETEDRGTAYDKKLVLIEHRSPGSIFWSAPEVLVQVAGDEGGYKQWRTVRASLVGFEDQEVRFTLRFDTVNEKHNGYRGWLVDDFSVGQDDDGDQLPNVLEEQTYVFHFSSQVEPILLDDNSASAAPIMASIRASAEGLIVDALIRHDEPNKMKVTLGTLPTELDAVTREFVLFNAGTVGTSCTFHPPGMAFGGASRPAIRKVSDGIDVKLDVMDCSAALDALTVASLAIARTWYLKIEDTTTDGKHAFLERFRLVDYGHTDAAAHDTDQDGLWDGIEQSRGSDPLGADEDRDFISDLYDPAPTMSAGLPSVLFVSDNHRERAFFQVVHPYAPITSIKFVATIGSDSVPVPYETLTRTAWQLDIAALYAVPDAMTVSFVDGFDNGARYEFEYVVRTGGVLEPGKVVMTTTNHDGIVPETAPPDVVETLPPGSKVFAMTSPGYLGSDVVTFTQPARDIVGRAGDLISFFEYSATHPVVTQPGVVGPNNKIIYPKDIQVANGGIPTYKGGKFIGGGGLLIIAGDLVVELLVYQAITDPFWGNTDENSRGDRIIKLADDESVLIPKEIHGLLRSEHCILVRDLEKWIRNPTSPGLVGFHGMDGVQRLAVAFTNPNCSASTFPFDSPNQLVIIQIAGDRGSGNAFVESYEVWHPPQWIPDYDSEDVIKDVTAKVKDVTAFYLAAEYHSLFLVDELGNTPMIRVGPLLATRGIECESSEMHRLRVEPYARGTPIPKHNSEDSSSRVVLSMNLPPCVAAVWSAVYNDRLSDEEREDIHLSIDMVVGQAALFAAQSHMRTVEKDKRDGLSVWNEKLGWFWLDEHVYLECYLVDHVENRLDAFFLAYDDIGSGPLPALWKAKSDVPVTKMNWYFYRLPPDCTFPDQCGGGSPGTYTCRDPFYDYLDFDPLSPGKAPFDIVQNTFASVGVVKSSDVGGYPLSVQNWLHQKALDALDGGAFESTCEQVLVVYDFARSGVDAPIRVDFRQDGTC